MGRKRRCGRTLRCSGKESSRDLVLLEVVAELKIVPIRERVESQSRRSFFLSPSLSPELSPFSVPPLHLDRDSTFTQALTAINFVHKSSLVVA